MSLSLPPTLVLPLPAVCVVLCMWCLGLQHPLITLTSAVLLSKIAGLPAGHGVKSIIQRYEDGPRSPTDNTDSSTVLQGKELGRSESMKDKGKTGVRHERRTKSDVDMDDNTIKALDQSGSSSTSSLSNRADSSETVNDMIANDSDLDVEAELPSLKSILGDEVIKKLKPKEKKRQEVLNELFYTERAHVRHLKILDQLFHRPMLATHVELARSLFPNISQMIELHRTMNNEMKKRRQEASNVSLLQVADILLRRFDGTNGEIFQQACAEYCRNQPHALEALKKHQRKEQRLSMFLNEAESSPLCRRLQLKDLLPAQMQRLTKYPLLIDNLMKYTQANSEEHTLLDKAKLKSKNILAYVNQSVKDCENFYRLRNLQRRLDLRPVENLSSHPSYEEMKNLELTSHKLVYDGNLSMRQRAHRMMEVHVVLLEDIMVLLQKQDDKLLLCQSNVQSSRVDPDKYINTHSPLLKLQNLLARNVATDKKAFFVVNTENSGPQIYEFVAPTQDERKKWMKYINDSVEEVKKRDGNKLQPFVPPQLPPQVPNIPPPEEITLRRDQITRSPHDRSTTPPHEASRQSSQVGSETADMSQTNESTLIQPDEVQISGPVVGQAEQVLTPIEKLRRNDETLETALEEREKIMAEIIGMPPEESRVAPEVPEVPSDEPNSRQTLIMAAMEINKQVVHLFVDASSHSAQMAFPSSSPQTSHSGAARADPPKVTIPIPMEQLRDMATRMNQILAKLLTAVNNQDEEKESLREELQQAQEKLNSLREIQRAVMGGTLPYSPQSRPSSIVSVGSSVTEEGGDTEGGASQTPSVDDVADSLRAQAQQMMVEVGLPVEGSSVDAGSSPRQQTSSPHGSKPAAAADAAVRDTGDTVPDESADSDKLRTAAAESDSDLEYQEIPEEVPSDVLSESHDQLQQQQAPANSNNNSSDADVMKMLNMENAKNEIVSVAEQFADKAEIESVISQSAEDMMSSTLTTDLDEGANDSDSEVAAVTVPPDLGDLGETDTDSVQKLEGVVLPGGITSEELVADERTKSTDCDVEGEDANASSSNQAEPVEI